MIQKERIIAVDFLRGITVAGMILVNNPGNWDAIYPPLEHSHWNGCTLADLVFPFFLFIVGLSINYALSFAKEVDADQKGILIKIIKRSLILFALGLFLNGFPSFDLETLRIPGVLQRIALVFFFCSLIFIKTTIKAQWIITATLLLVYWIVMSFIPVPGIGEANFNINTNLAAYIDNMLLPDHMWRYSKTWDPEGLLSTLPAIGTGMIGVLAGNVLKSKNDPYDKIEKLFVGGAVLMIAGIVWSFQMPINKSIWTSSFTIFTGGTALVVLSFCYWAIDVKKYSGSTKPFIAFGSNAIVAYMISELLARVLDVFSFIGPKNLSVHYWIWSTIFEPNFAPPMASLLMAIFWVVLIFVPIWVMYKKKIFVKV